MRRVIPVRDRGVRKGKLEGRKGKREGLTKCIRVPPMMALTVSPWTVRAPFCCATGSVYGEGRLAVV